MLVPDDVSNWFPDPVNEPRRAALLSMNSNGLYCPAGDFYVDPVRPVDRAIITHAHSDHARRGCRAYLTSESGLPLLRARIGPGATIQTVPFGRTLNMEGVSVSLHPAGHILGSAQVRIEHRGEAWVVTGDYKTTEDRTCESFELVPCDTLVTECTFGLPIYRWESATAVADRINGWWADNRSRGVVSVLLGYSLGKAQRLIGLLDPSIGPIYCHPAVEKMNRHYRKAGRLPVEIASLPTDRARLSADGGVVIAPPSRSGISWIDSGSEASVASASGWMAVRGFRGRRGCDRGFVLSDHVDWPGLNAVVEASGCSRMLATHGYVEPVCRWWTAKGLDARPLKDGSSGTTGESGRWP